MNLMRETFRFYTEDIILYKVSWMKIRQLKRENTLHEISVYVNYIVLRASHGNDAKSDN
jgi:hypothetical protein